jgi:rare lipoprotein A
MRSFALTAAVCLTVACAPMIAPAFAETGPPASPAAQQEAKALNAMPAVPVPHVPNPPTDHSGRKELGNASYYAPKFDGRKMADGKKYSPEANVAASKTLPLGTTAKVVNLDTGRSATVRVEDRGPHVNSRMLDVSPKVAERLDMRHEGVAPVVVKPITVPQPNGGVKLGAGAAETPAPQVEQAVRTTQELAQARR